MQGMVYLKPQVRSLCGYKGMDGCWVQVTAPTFRQHKHAGAFLQLKGLGLPFPILWLCIQHVINCHLLQSREHI